MADWLDEVAEKNVDFEYDAVKDTTRRRSPKRIVQDEDRHLRKKERKNLVATSRDVRRNFVMARWAIHKHVDFVVDHTFQSNTGNPDLDKTINEFFRRVSSKEFFDISGRHDLRRFMRLAESARIVDGDFFAVRQRGGYLQAIESDRLLNPENANTDTADNVGSLSDPGVGWTHGIYTDRNGRPLRYSIAKRVQSGFAPEAVVKASAVIPLGFYDRFDQVRGISPLASAINSLKDLYESYDYALAKAKVAQLFALAVTRDADWGLGEDEDDNDNSPDRTVSFDKGPQILDLDGGEDAKFLSVNTPEKDTAEFWKNQTGLVLKALHIPYCFWDENNSTFHSSKTATVLYMRAVKQWREDVVAFMNEWFCWRLKVGVLRGEIKLPSDYECEPKNWLWIPAGLAYWDPMKEVNADIAALDARLTTRSEIRRLRFGDDWEANVANPFAEELKLMTELDIEPDSEKEPPAPVIPGNPNNEEDKQDNDD